VALPQEHEEDPVPSGEGVIHVVEPGQTLWRIARAYGVPVEQLAAANRIEDPARLPAGYALLVPGATRVLEVPPYPAPPPTPWSAPGGPSGGPPSVTFVWPVAGGRVLSGFGDPRGDHIHQGLDIGGRHGQPVLAAASGRVIYSAGMRGYGKTIILEHEGGYRSLYAHNSDLLVDSGDQVAPGDPIAVLGRTGNATAEHCHFEVRRDRMPVNPQLLIAQQAPSDP
jgi:murein DD-endopeptidase MepM/ murein hydrolase activator NlpD